MFASIHPSYHWTMCGSTQPYSQWKIQEKKNEWKKSVIIFDVKLLSIFNIKLHSCWVIWLLNKYMVMPAALMSIICCVCCVDKNAVDFSPFSSRFFSRLLFASGLKFASTNSGQCTRSRWTRSVQLNCTKNKGPIDGGCIFSRMRTIRPYHIRYECNCHVIWLFIVSFFLPFSRWKLTLMHFWSTIEPSSDRRRFDDDFEEDKRHPSNAQWQTVARRLVKCSIVS